MACLSLVFHVNSLASIPLFRRRYDDDFADRLSNRYSFFLFIVLGIICSARESYEPMNCLPTTPYNPYWTDYINRICWISNTYHVPVTDKIPNKGDGKNWIIAYYQWVPLMMFLQAILIFAPRIIWTSLNKSSGIHINKIVSKVTEAEFCTVQVQEKLIKEIVGNLERAFLTKKKYRPGACQKLKYALHKYFFYLCGKRYGNYLSVLYLFIKLVYVANCIGQLFLLNAFLGDGYHLYGFSVLSDLIQGRNWTTPRHFPHVTMCDFEIRTLGERSHDYVVQCVLPANLLNEKIFIFVWFWLVFTSGVTILSLFIWIWKLFRRNRHQFVQKYLKIMKQNFDKEDDSPSQEFCEDYLKYDGVFVLQLIRKNTNDILVGELVWALWDGYKKHSRTNDTTVV